MDSSNIDLSLDDIIKIQRKEKKKLQNKGKNVKPKPGTKSGAKAGQKNKIKQFRGAIAGKKLSGMNNIRRNQIALKARRTQNKNKQRLARQNATNNNRGLQSKPQKGQARKKLNRNNNFSNTMVADQITQQQTQRRQWKRNNASVKIGGGNQSIMTVSVPNKKQSNDVAVQIAPQRFKINRQQQGAQNGRHNNHQVNNNNTPRPNNQRKRNRIRFPTTQTNQFQFKRNDFAASKTSLTMNERFASVHSKPNRQNLKQPRQNRQGNQRMNQRVNRRRNNQARQNQARQNQQNQGRKVFL